jgi:hypothetical protein
MSHIEEVKTELTDKEIILAVCKELELLGKENVSLEIYDRSKLVAEIQLTKHLGLNKAEDGTYKFVGDFWYMRGDSTTHPKIENSKEGFINQFNKMYTETKVDKELRSKRFRQTKREKRDDGCIVLKYVRSL